ncbi:hypothetical protein [Kitasatospora sp. NPDC057198]|uniref:hypothetical protein n=1 Tax=Kitasatospora sp. NPDC057198 TaxID=3346046 RepID=UPI0036274A84
MKRRHAEYGAALYLLIDRQDRACTLFSEPGAPGCTRAVGPLPFGELIELPEPFGEPFGLPEPFGPRLNTSRS